MATKTDDLPDLDAEREVDLRRHWNTIATHWWVVLAGVAAGIVIGYLISLGGSQIYRAKAVVYIGQPLSSSGVQVQSAATNPSTVRQIVLAPETIDLAARRAGLKPSELRGHVSTQTISGSITRLGQNPLVSVGVTGHLPRKVATAANALAAQVVTNPALAGYVLDKIKFMRRQVEAEDAELASIDTTTTQQRDAIRNAGTLSTVEKLILTAQLNGLLQERRQLVDQQAGTQQQLTLARQVEAPRIITRATALKTTARSRRNTVLVAALIGLILGAIAALLYEPALRVVRRHS